MTTMKKTILTLGALAICLSMGIKMQAQTNSADHAISLGLAEVALLGTQSGPVNLVLSGSLAAGEAVLAEKSDSSAYIQYSSVISEGSPRTLYAKYTGTVPPGTFLKALVKVPGANSSGDFGTPIATAVTLAATDNALVTNIGSCYSGTVATDGYNLKYTWGLDNPEANYAEIRATAAAAVTVTLTITGAI